MAHREFGTGATRDKDEGKLDYEGFLSPVVLERFGEYMHKNRLQEDGSLRDSANWQLGIPKEAYMKSMLRHVFDVWGAHRTGQTLTGEGLEDALCAVMFNTQGMLFELLKEKNGK